MKYMVSCALDANQSLSWHDPWNSTNYTWNGALGLCPAWNTSAPTQECLERVSSCLLARVNAFGTTVHLSMHGEKSDLFPLAKEPMVSFNSTATGGTVPDFLECKPGQPSVGLNRSCGWKASHIGRCAPTKPVTVGVGAAPGCVSTLGTAGSPDLIMRVCDGIRGCGLDPNNNPINGPILAAADDTCGRNPAVKFTCPASGLYNVMLGEYSFSVTTSPNGTPGIDAVSGTMPLDEQQLFQWREGAFYGNIFDADALAPEANVTVTRDGTVTGREFRALSTDGVVYGNMFACYSSNWTMATAYLTKRICAGFNCAAEVVGACQSNVSGEAKPSMLCQKNDGTETLGDYDYDVCLDSSLATKWQEPITTFLATPCDIVSDVTACKTKNPTPVLY
jgi:hypothetical protein